MSKNTKRIIAVIALLVLIAAAIFAYTQFSPKASAGGKEIAVTVIHGDGSEKLFELSTDAESLRDALEPLGIIEGSEDMYGLYVKTADGETVDESLQQWWCFTKGGESLMTGVDGIMIADGDKYEITLKTGW